MTSEDDVVAWFYEAASELLEESVGMGTMEKIVARVSMECRRRVLERLVQEAADQEALLCPRCEQALNVEEHHRARRVNTTFGLIRYTRSYGSCTTCEEYLYAADVTLGCQGQSESRSLQPI